MDHLFPLLHPVPIVLLGVRCPGNEKKADFTTIGDVAVAGLNPALVMVSLHERHLAREGVDLYRRFSLHVLDSTMAGIARHCGEVSGREEDKSLLFDFEWKDDIPVIHGMPVVLLCETRKRVAVGKRIVYVAAVTDRILREDVLADDLRNWKTLQYGLDDHFYESGRLIDE